MAGQSGADVAILTPRTIASAADVAADAIVRGVRMATSAPDWPAIRDL